MTRCPSCSAGIADGAAACRVCGAALAPEEVPTVAPPPARGMAEGRFQIGDVVAGRYRILGLIGRGGMGEVYRAHDIKLDQQVALKFLPEALGRDGAAVARFHNEVRTARKVTHPNVCRVHDIGEADGVPFISMEYIDGEDLATLLARIGRLPQDKGIEVAHGLCAGLAAAHARGVLHRDLKPANIMLNRAGRVLITDFGLAGVAAEFRGADVVAGTPAYMAPEQVQGREVTARSDLYALGLVLYEIFTGTRVFDGLARPAVAAPSLLVKDLSPAIDRIVLACLHGDPERRPPSAGAIAQALPGGDPLAAAMRAGQTPSPEMVAASRATATLSVRGATICFAAVVALLVGAYALIPDRRDIGMAPLETPPDALVARARDIAAAAGYDAPPRDAAYSFERDNAHLDYLEARGFEWSRLAELRPGTFTWWYRQSPAWLVPRGLSPSVTRADPPAEPGAVAITLDPRSRLLLAFSAIPQERRGTGAAGTGGTPGGEPDWKPLFVAAGLDQARFTEVVPELAPGGGFDLRRAWVGSAAASPETPVRVEAAALNGRPVWFVPLHPWSGAQAAYAEPNTTTFLGMPAVPMSIGLMSVTIIAASFLVRRNHRLGRVDLRGGGTIAVAVFWLTLAAWLLRAHLAPTADMFPRLTQAVGTSLFAAAFVFIAYAGVDPYARRYWPASLVSWTRLVHGRLRDPLVGQDILVGTLAGLAMTAGFIVYCLAGAALNGRPASAMDGFRVIDITLPRMLARSADAATFALYNGVGGLVLLLLLKALLRRYWLAIVAWSLLGGLTWWPAFGPSYPLLAFTCTTVSSIPLVWTMSRHGLLPAAIAAWVFTVATLLPAWNPTLWYGPAALANGVLILALAAYGLRTALRGRPVFGGFPG